MEQYMSSFNNCFLDALKLNGLEEYEKHSSEFEELFKALAETNKLYNLTAVTDEKGVASLHFADSLLGMSYINDSLGETEGKKLLDVGCGAGFPCLPIAIVSKGMTVNGLDSTAKKVDFSNGFAKSIGLNNFRSISGRAEELAKTDMRESYDLVTARAVSRLNVLIEITLPFVKVGGYFLAMKGSKGLEELEEAKNGIRMLGGSVVKVEEKELKLENETQKRTFILIKKVAKTEAKYPRMYSKIVKSPLK